MSSIPAPSTPAVRPSGGRSNAAAAAHHQHASLGGGNRVGPGGVPHPGVIGMHPGQQQQQQQAQAQAQHQAQMQAAQQQAAAQQQQQHGALPPLHAVGTPANQKGAANNMSTPGSAGVVGPLGSLGGGSNGGGGSGSSSQLLHGHMLPPPDNVFSSFEDLLSSVQKVAKDQGYFIVKLRASNYRDSKPTRYDLVCDRGGVKYTSSAKKRTPTTRKVDCPWRAKAVCEVQLGMQWRFQVQEARHNHDPRVAVAQPGQEITPVAQSLKTTTHKLDRLNVDVKTGFGQIMAKLEALDKKIDGMEQRMDARFAGLDARFAVLEQRNSMDLPLGDVDVDTRLVM